MYVLVTGGTGVVGTATTRALLERGHRVRLFSRHATDDGELWAEGVDACDGSVDDPASLRAALAGCDAVVHLAGTIAERPPEITYELVNVQGTSNVITEAERAGVTRFLYISSLGAEHGASAYHHSKRRAELLTHGFKGNWTILRPGNVYGPGDEVISTLLLMVRTLPAIPVIAGGEHLFQPIAADDLGEAIARAVERDDLAGRAIDLAGAETTSMSDLLDRFARLTGKAPARIPMPAWLASSGTALLSAMGLGTAVNPDQITMLLEENVLDASAPNALVELFGLTPTTLEDGLAGLCDSLPEQLPSEGKGRLFRRRFWADIENSSFSAEALFARFRRRFAAIAPEATMDVGAEPGSARELIAGETITMALPLRGNVQVRVEEVTARSATVVTVAGHPLAGGVRFLCEQRGDALRFEVQTYDRAANHLDLLAMSTVGRVLKSRTWAKIVQTVVDESGGHADGGPHSESKALDEEQAKRVEDWIEQLVLERRRAESDERVSAARGR
ncbi:MAG: NAD-dependent epimerase/dehydratase family protein [Gemmatimonadota bacterium]|nr:NAD-dependent epimerase/dehydratase family protein [Gemmatimonadota bacterium]